MEEYPMKRVIQVTIVASVVLLLGGCATKKYVAKQTDPITAKVAEVKAGAEHSETMESDEPKISAGRKKRISADARAGMPSGVRRGLQENRPG